MNSFSMFDIFLVVLSISAVFLTYYLVAFVREYLKTMKRADKVFGMIEESFDSFEKLIVDATTKLESLNSLFHVLESFGKNLDYISTKTSELNEIIANRSEQLTKIISIKDKFMKKSDEEERK